MKGEFDSPSKPATEAYRENWQRIYLDAAEAAINNPLAARFAHFHGAVPTDPSYPNGCPILPSEQD